MADRFAGNDLTCIRGGRLVFKNLAFDLERGGALILRGPNGSGKSSLLRLMAGLGRATTGHITWDDGPIADDMAAHAERLHYIGHKNATKSALTARENLEFWAALRGSESSVTEAIENFGLNRLADLPARLFSSGETRRLALARLAANKATLWLLDEPTVGLDQTSVTCLSDLVRRHRAKGGMVVLSVHGPFALENSRTLDLGTRS
ncbi:MAG: heme ABC exporter ATP-binding protein CcmA [Proteobacteria bacterium]|nr:heme ABC exporter ATP-binding protein CcmA [Pseudomonadota bacterium]